MLCLFAGSLYAQPAPITGATCVSTGTFVVSTTIRISGGTYDGGCRTYIPGPGMDVNSHSETIVAQSVLFRLENGARLRNVIIAPSPWLASAKAINIYAGATLENINITKVFSEVAISVKTAGTLATAALTNSRLHDVRTICTGYSAGKCITSGNVIY